MTGYKYEEVKQLTPKEYLTCYLDDFRHLLDTHSVEELSLLTSGTQPFETFQDAFEYYKLLKKTVEDME